METTFTERELKSDLRKAQKELRAMKLEVAKLKGEATSSEQLMLNMKAKLDELTWWLMDIIVDGPHVLSLVDSTSVVNASPADQSRLDAEAKLESLLSWLRGVITRGPEILASIQK